MPEIVVPGPGEEPAGREWPGDLLDIDQLIDGGWRPHPFQQFILKVHGRCNLACDYCYVYRSADQTWRDRPPRMSEATVLRTAERIAEHVGAHDLPAVDVVLHGGEPLLAGSDFLSFVSTALRDAVPSAVRVDVSVQTNATLLDEAMLDVLGEQRIHVGVSLDGDRSIHDTRRQHIGGQGSYGEVVRGLDLLRSRTYRHLYAGLLCVVDLRGDPVATYEHLLAYDPPVLDLLLPHANWSDPPRRPPGTSYGGWLVSVFDRWYSAERRETSIRLFEGIIRGVLGRPSRVESIGLSPVRHVVVETDGAIEQVDALRSAYTGAASTGLHVEAHPFDTALTVPGVVVRQLGTAALSSTCRRCELRDVCGGGFYPHRYRRGSGFGNPSVYCDDLAGLVRHVQGRVQRDVARHLAR